MSKLKKVFIALFVIGLISFISICLYIFCIIITIDKNELLDLSKISINNSQIKIYDSSNNEFVTTSANGTRTTELSSLAQYIPQAFISIEDKDFYQHKGLNYKRIIKASFVNILSGSFKEGASTITQQLIKNSLLSSEKTINRKIKEAYLAINLEKKFNKDKILESYLNSIYFGNGAYGIENASLTYFNKTAKELTIAESATLAGIIQSPHNYSLITNLDKCISRRNLVLKNMLTDKYITQSEYNEALNEKPTISLKYDNNDLLKQRIIEEAMSILKLSEKDIANSGLKIYTKLDNEIQSCLSQNSSESISNCLIVIDNEDNTVIYYRGNGKLKRQVGSLIKPILCYAPAYEYGLISPSLPINDEKTNFSGYSPKNANNKYMGWTDVQTSTAKSLNVPAIKILEYVGIDKSKKFATKLGLNFDETDNHLAIALGAVKYGFDCETMVNAYSTFARLGQYSKIKFIKEIRNNKNEPLYQIKNDYKNIISAETCYLLNDTLKKTVTCGTAKKLSNLNQPLCAKTGTVGGTGTSNTDAWCVSYSPKFTVLSWFGNTTTVEENNLTRQQNGGTIAAEQNKLVWNELIKKYTYQKDFKKPINIIEKKIDTISLQEHKLELSTENTPECYTQIAIFNKNFLPKTSNRFIEIMPPDLKLNTNDKNIILQWDGQEYLKYEIYVNEGKFDEINGENRLISYLLNKPQEVTEYYLLVKYKATNLNKTAESNKVKYYIDSSLNKSSTLNLIASKWLK